MRRTCARCGSSEDAGGADSSEDGSGLPAGWSLSTSERGVQFLCAACTRANVRAIEAKLPEEWWE